MKNSEEVIEKLEQLKKVAPNPQSIVALQIAINTVRDRDSFSHWIENLDSEKFDTKEQMLFKIQMKSLLGAKGE